MADPAKAKAPEDAVAKAKAKANVDTADAWARRRPGQMHGETHYLLTGPRESPKLAVCVSGIGGLHIYFDAMEPALVAQGFKVLRYDLWGRGWSGPAPGHARSKPPGCCGGCVPLEEDPYGLDSHVEQLHGLLTGLNLIQEDGGASGGDDEPKDPHRLSMSVSRQQRDIDASLSSSVSSVSGSGAAAASSYPQTWPPQQSSRAAAVAAAAATTATTTTATATTTAAAATKNTSAICGGAAGGGVGGLPSVPETAEVTAPADATPVRQVHVIGHSMGGAIAVGFADRHPELVASLTLLTPAGLMDPGQFRLLRALPCCIQRVVQASLRRHVGNAVRNDFLVHNTPLEERVLEQVGRLVDRSNRVESSIPTFLINMHPSNHTKTTTSNPNPTKTGICPPQAQPHRARSLLPLRPRLPALGARGRRPARRGHARAHTPDLGAPRPGAPVRATLQPVEGAAQDGQQRALRGDRGRLPRLPLGAAGAHQPDRSPLPQEPTHLPPDRGPPQSAVAAADHHHLSAGDRAS